MTRNCKYDNAQYPNQEATDVQESSASPGTNPHNIGKKSGPNAVAIAGRREATLHIGVQGTRRCSDLFQEKGDELQTGIQFSLKINHNGVKAFLKSYCNKKDKLNS